MGLQAVEYDIFEFVEMRCRELKSDVTADVLFDEASGLRKKMESHRSLRFHAAWVGSLIGLLGCGAAAIEISSSSLNGISLVTSGAAIALSFWLGRFFFQGERLCRFNPAKSAQQKFEIEHSSLLDEVIDPIRHSRARLAKLSSTGEGVAFTPTSNRPIEKHLSNEALDDAWLPGEILHQPIADNHATAAYIVILMQEIAKPASSSRDKWKRYYLWHQESALVMTLFDRAQDIYREDKIKRIKARVAVRMVVEHFKDCRERNIKVKSQHGLAKDLVDHLKLEASRLEASGEIDYRESLLLERVGMSGTLKSGDPAEPSSVKNDAPESWFEQLLSGTNMQILPALRVEALKEFPTLPEFIEA